MRFCTRFFSFFLRRFLLPKETAFIRLENVGELKSAYKKRVREFKRKVRMHDSVSSEIAREVKDRYKSFTHSEEAISYAYDLEYAGSDPNYTYISPILLKRGFEIITRFTAQNAPSLTILDVGAGSNEFLRFCSGELGVPSVNLYGSDISKASFEIITRDGFHGYHGRLEKLPLPSNFFNLVFLSYFIDYDTNQAETFVSAIDRVCNQGRIVLEGWFPVRPFALNAGDKDTFSFITKGRNEFEDVMLIFEYMQDVCVKRNDTIVLEQVCRGTRYVQSRYGFHALPSWFMTLKVEKR